MEEWLRGTYLPHRRQVKHDAKNESKTSDKTWQGNAISKCGLIYAIEYYPQEHNQGEKKEECKTTYMEKQTFQASKSPCMTVE